MARKLESEILEINQMRNQQLEVILSSLKEQLAMAKLLDEESLLAELNVRQEFKAVTEELMNDVRDAAFMVKALKRAMTKMDQYEKEDMPEEVLTPEEIEAIPTGDEFLEKSMEELLLEEDNPTVDLEATDLYNQIMGLCGEGEDIVNVEQTPKIPIDPWNKKEINDPVKNRICGHIYDKTSLEAQLCQSVRPRCPYMGCNNREILGQHSVMDDPETLEMIQQIRANPQLNQTASNDKSTVDLDSTTTSGQAAQDENVAVDEAATDN